MNSSMLCSVGRHENDFNFREFEKLRDKCESSKTKYSELEQKSTKAGEDLKHLTKQVRFLIPRNRSYLRY